MLLKPHKPFYSFNLRYSDAQMITLTNYNMAEDYILGIYFSSMVRVWRLNGKSRRRA